MKVLTFFLIVVGIGLLGFFWLAIAGLLTYFWWLPIALELVALGVYLQVKYSKTAIKTMGIVSWVAAFLLLIIFLPYEALERRSSNRVFGAVSVAISVQNGRIAFVSERDGNAEIYVMNADGSGQTRLTNNPANDSIPACGP